MDAIARELQVSRATVSRLLARARAEGIVEITVFTPGAQASCLATELRDRHGVETLVVPLPKESSIEERHARTRSEEHTSELQSRGHLVCRLLLDTKKTHQDTLQVHGKSTIVPKTRD